MKISVIDYVIFSTGYEDNLDLSKINKEIFNDWKGKTEDREKDSILDKLENRGFISIINDENRDKLESEIFKFLKDKMNIYTSLLFKTYNNNSIELINHITKLKYCYGMEWYNIIDSETQIIELYEGKIRALVIILNCEAG